MLSDSLEDGPLDDLARRIQHTLIRPGLDEDDIEAHCAEARRFAFDAVMIPGRWVSIARRLLERTPVKVASAVDFPHGGMSGRGRIAEAQALVDMGAQELDLGLPVGLLRKGHAHEFHEAMESLVRAVDVPIKVMLDLPLLPTELWTEALRLAVEAGVDCVKNASGSDVGMATEDEIRFLRDGAPAQVRVKASGGIKTRAQASALIEAGADLIGTSAAVTMMLDVPPSADTSY